MRNKTDTAIRVVTFLLAAIGAFLGYADKIGDAPAFLKEYSHLWPAFVAGAVALKQGLLLVADLLDDGVKNDSFKL